MPGGTVKDDLVGFGESGRVASNSAPDKPINDFN